MLIIDVLHRCAASGRSLIWSTKGTLFCLIHVWAGPTPLHMHWFLEIFTCDNYWMMKKPSFRFWSKCENCFLAFSPTREVCGLTLSVLHTCHWTSACHVPCPLLEWAFEGQRKQYQVYHRVTSKTLGPEGVCMWENSDSSWGSHCPPSWAHKHVVAGLRILLFGAFCSSLFSCTQRKVPVPRPPFLLYQLQDSIAHSDQDSTFWPCFLYPNSLHHLSSLSPLEGSVSLDLGSLSWA